MLVKTEPLTGSRLDWAVSTALGYKPVLNMESHGTTWRGWWLACGEYRRMPRYHSEWEGWSESGPLFDRERIQTVYDDFWVYDPEDLDDNGERWYAYTCKGSEGGIYGPTKLVAGLRCLVASKLGDTVEIPDNLLEHLP